MTQHGLALSQRLCQIGRMSRSIGTLRDFLTWTEATRFTDKWVSVQIFPVVCASSIGRDLAIASTACCRGRSLGQNARLNRAHLIRLQSIRSSSRGLEELARLYGINRAGSVAFKHRSN